MTLHQRAHHYLAEAADQSSAAIINDLLSINKQMQDAMQLFVDKVDRGEIRSKKTYASFKFILGQLSVDDSLSAHVEPVPAQELFYDQYGRNNDGSGNDLVSGCFYLAKFLGAYDGAADASPADDDYRPYEAVRTGSLFILRRPTSLNGDGSVGPCRFYHVPELFVVCREISEAEVLAYLRSSK